MAKRKYYPGYGAVPVPSEEFHLSTGNEDPVQAPHADYVLTPGEDDDGAELKLAPPDGKTAAEADLSVVQRLEAARQALITDRHKTARRPFQFTLLELLTLMTAVSVGLGTARFMPPGGFAWLAVIVALMSAGVGAALGTEYRPARIICWSVAFTYASMAFVSFVQAVA